MWTDLDLDAGTLVVMRNRLRPRWQHGCVRSCGRKQAGYCPQRVPARQETAAAKVARRPAWNGPARPPGGAAARPS
jgi:hypothetical protein